MSSTFSPIPAATLTSSPLSSRFNTAPTRPATQLLSRHAQSAPGIFDALAHATAEVPTRIKPAWWQAIAAAPTRRVLCRQQQCDALPGSVWQARILAFDAHVARLAPGQALTWTAQQIIDVLHLPRVFLNLSLFPGQSLWAPYRGLLHFEEDGLSLAPQCAITQDHAVLDGVLVRHAHASSKGQTAPAARPPVVIVPGNAMRWEDCQIWLASLASLTRRDVLMFNYRNMGTSIGSACNTNTSIQDAQAALLCAQAMVPGAPLSVIGVSMGGGASAAAIAALKEAKSISHADTAVWVGLHTFGSVHCLIGARFGSLALRLSPAIFALLGLDSLDTQQTMQRVPLAQQISLLHAHHDALLSPEHTLKLTLPWPTTWSPVVTRADATHDAGQRHGDLIGALAAGTWRAQVARS